MQMSRRRRAPSLAVRDAAAVTTATVAFTLKNNTGSGQVYAVVTGQAIDSGSALMLLRSDGQTPYFPAAPAGLDTICAGLTAQAAADGHPWGDLIVTSGGRNLRALGPINGIARSPSFLSGYYDSYVGQAWTAYASAPLTIDTQASFGKVTGQVSNDLLTFPGVGSFARPSAALHRPPPQHPAHRRRPAGRREPGQLLRRPGDQPLCADRVCRQPRRPRLRVPL